jgi:hypothetical protein
MPYEHSQVEGRHPEGITDAPFPPLDPTEDPDAGRFGFLSPEFNGPPTEDECPANTLREGSVEFDGEEAELHAPAPENVSKHIHKTP